MSAARVKQAYVYSNTYDKSINKPAIQQFLTSLIILCTSTRIIDMPTEERNKLITLLKSIFFSEDSTRHIAPNAIYRDFLMKLKKMVEDNILTRSQLELLRDNLTYIEESRITGFIPYPQNSTQFISNSHIVQFIQDTLQHNNIPTTSNEQMISFDEVAHLGDKLLEKTSYGKANSKAKKHRTQRSRSPYSKPPCKYGASCYRKNPEHLREYSHPAKGGKRTYKKVYHNVRYTVT